MSKYEKARILGLRICQLNEGSKPYIEVKNHKVIDNHVIAEKELHEKKLPFVIMRPLPNGQKEYWRLEDLKSMDNSIVNLSIHAIYIYIHIHTHDCIMLYDGCINKNKFSVHFIIHFINIKISFFFLFCISNYSIFHILYIFIINHE